MSESENIHLAEQLLDNINQHKVRRNMDYLAPFYQFEFPGAVGPLSRDQSVNFFQDYITAFPDFHFDIKGKIAQGDFVVFMWIASGTHRGPLRTPTGVILQPTERRCTISGCNVYQFKHGQAVRGWWFWDMVTLFSQLGVMPVF